MLKYDQVIPFDKAVIEDDWAIHFHWINQAACTRCGSSRVLSSLFESVPRRLESRHSNANPPSLSLSGSLLGKTGNSITI